LEISKNNLLLSLVVAITCSFIIHLASLSPATGAENDDSSSIINGKQDHTSSGNLTPVSIFSKISTYLSDVFVGNSNNYIKTETPIEQLEKRVKEAEINGKENIILINNLNRLGLAYKWDKQYNKAESSFRKSIKLTTTSKGVKSRALLTPLTPLIDLCIRNKNYKEAKQYTKQKITIVEHNEMKNNIALLIPLLILEAVCRMQNNEDEANQTRNKIALIVEQLEIDNPPFKDALGRTCTPTSSHDLTILKDKLAGQGLHATIELILRGNVKRIESDKNLNFDRRIGALDTLALFLQQQKQIHKALTLYLHIETLLSQNTVSNDIRIIERWKGLNLMRQASIYVDMKNYKKAESLYKKMINKMEAAVSRNQRLKIPPSAIARSFNDLGFAYDSLGTLYNRTGRKTQAFKILEKGAACKRKADRIKRTGTLQ